MWKIMNIILFEAYIGLLILNEGCKSQGESTKSLLDKQT